MNEFVIILFSVVDETALGSYRQNAAETVKRYGGHVLASGALAPTRIGTAAYENSIVIGFKDPGGAAKWIDSVEYRALDFERASVMDATFMIIGGASPPQNERLSLGLGLDAS